MQKERNEQLREWARNLLIYIVLLAVAYLMLFPFIYMFTTSLKITTDVFRTPPRLLPYVPEQVMFNGEMVNSYAFDVDGQQRALVEDTEAPNIRFNFFTTADKINTEFPRESEIVASVPTEAGLSADTAVETGNKVTVNGEEYDEYTVTVNGQAQTLLQVFRAGKKTFVDPNDPSVRAFAVEGVPLERVEFQWQNYNELITAKNLDRSLINTALVTFFVTAGQVITSLLGGYAFSRIPFRGRETLFFVYLGTIMIPFVVLIIPLFQLMVFIGWRDHLASLIIPWLFTAYGTFLMRQFFITIPKDLEEAALLDGLGRFGILWRIFVPLSGPAIATQAIITFLYAWNSFVWPLVVINEGNTPNHVVTLTLNQLRNAASDQPNILLTGAAIAILPPLILFIFAQRYFIEGIANTGGK
jgi:ABC-type glycerol-3-phosphate transport system permease component